MRRLGIALAHPALIQILMNTKAPYNVSTPTASLALAALSPEAVVSMRQKLQNLVAGREWLLQQLSALFPNDLGPAIGGNAANFIVVPVLEKNGSGKPDSVRAQWGGVPRGPCSLLTRLRSRSLPAGSS